MTMYQQTYICTDDIQMSKHTDRHIDIHSDRTISDIPGQVAKKKEKPKTTPNTCM